MKTLPKVAVVLIVLLLGTVNLFAQAPDTLWTRTYGGTSGDGGSSVQQTTDGGYIIVGETWSFGAGEGDVYLIKTDSLGDTLWTKTYGGTDWDGGASVQQTLDGGYIIVGYTRSFGPGIPDYENIYIIKTDASGDTLWTKAYGGNSVEYGFSVQQTLDDGYIIVGQRGYLDASDVYLIKTDSLGDTLWTKTYGGTDWDIGSSVQQTFDGGYIVAGRIWSVGPNVSNVYLIKTDASGDSLWTKIYGGTSSQEIGFSVQQTSDSGYIVAGVITSGPGTTYGYLIKTDSLGDTLWTKKYGEGGDSDWLMSVQQTSDDGYIIAGFADSFGAGGLDVWVIRTDANGDTLWMKSYGGTADDGGGSVQQTSDGGYIVVGGTESYGAGEGDVWLIKIAPESGIEEEDTPNLFYISQSEPNPFNNITRVKYELPKSCNVHIAVYNVIGAKVKTLLNERRNAGRYTITWNGRDNSGNKVSSGFYFLRVEAEEYEGTRKLLLIK